MEQIEQKGTITITCDIETIFNKRYIEGITVTEDGVLVTYTLEGEDGSKKETVKIDSKFFVSNIEPKIFLLVDDVSARRINHE